VPYLVAILLMLGVRPVAADFAAAEAAEQRGDVLAAYEACKTDAEAGDAGCQNYLGVMSERGRGVRRNASPPRKASPPRNIMWDALTQRALGFARTSQRPPAGTEWRRNRAIPQHKMPSPFSRRPVVAVYAILRRRLTCFGAPR